MPSDCKFKVVVQLSVPKYPTEDQQQRAKVVRVVMRLKQEEFKFDITWFTSHFHDLDELWKNQSGEIKQKMQHSLIEAFSSAIQFNRPAIWLKRKFRQLDNEIIAAKKKSRQSEEN